MRFALYYPRALHGDGGVTNSMWLWVDSLLRVGAEVEVLYDPRLPRAATRTVPPGVTLRAVRHVGAGRLAVPRGLDRVLGRDAVLVLYSGYVLFNLVAAVVATRRGVPYVVTPLGAYDPHIRGRRPGVRRTWELAERRLLANSLAVHVCFDTEIDHIAAVAPDARTIVAPTAFGTTSRPWQRQDSEGYVAWLGRYDIRHKGLDRLLDAMAQLPPDRRPTLRMHGRDHKNSRAELHGMVAERGLQAEVQVLGSVSGAEKEEFLARAGAYIHPARWEAYGIALVENLARGVPCITTTDINLGEPLRSADAALVVDGSVAGLSAALGRMAGGDVASFGPRGRAFVRERLDHASVGRTLLDGVTALADAR